MAKKKTKTEEKAKLSDKEINELILNLSKQGNNATKIGQTLKDTYGVKSVKSIIKKKIKKILLVNGIKEQIPDDLNNLLKKAEILKKHFNANKQDRNSERSLHITEAKIRKISKYYKKILPADWKY